MPIDDSLEKIRNIADESDDPLSDLMLAGSVFSPLIALVGVVKGVMDAAEQKARFRAALPALCDELQAMKDKLPPDAESTLQQRWSRRAVQVLIGSDTRS